MTKQECAIVMAYTGICMLQGKDFQIFHKYVEDIMGRPVFTHEMGIKRVSDEIREKSAQDFCDLCKNAREEERMDGMKVEWIPVEEGGRLPEVDEDGYSEHILLSYDNYSEIDIGEYRVDENGDGAFYPGDDDRSCTSYGFIVNAWMPIIPSYRGNEDG